MAKKTHHPSDQKSSHNKDSPERNSHVLRTHALWPMSLEAAMNKTMSSTWSLSSDGKFPTTVDERRHSDDDDKGEDEEVEVIVTTFLSREQDSKSECGFEKRLHFPFAFPLLTEHDRCCSLSVSL